MNSYKNCRERLGLTQQEFADYLGVSRVMLSMIEINRRELPIEAFAKYGWLRRKYDEVLIKPRASDLIDEAQVVSINKLQYDLEGLGAEIYRTEKKFRTMQENYQNALLQIQTFENGFAQLQADDADYKGKKLAMEVFLNKASRNLTDYSLDKLMMVEAELAALKFKQTFIVEKLKDLEANGGLSNNLIQI